MTNAERLMTIAGDASRWTLPERAALLDGASVLSRGPELAMRIGALTAERDQLRAERDAATARAEAAEKEVERLRRELGARDVALSATTAAVRDDAKARWKANIDAATARAEAAEALVAGMRGALEEAVPVIQKVCRSTTEGHRDTGLDFPLDVMFFDVPTPEAVAARKAIKSIQAALALTPASAGAAIEARVWGEAAEKVSEWAEKLLGYERAAVLGCAANLTEIAEQRERADRLTAEEKEAANG